LTPDLHGLNRGEYWIPYLACDKGKHNEALSLTVEAEFIHPQIDECGEFEAEVLYLADPLRRSIGGQRSGAQRVRMQFMVGGRSDLIGRWRTFGMHKARSPPCWLQR
jgi:hypothetical protein